ARADEPAAGATDRTAYSTKVHERRLRESSGLALSRRLQDRFWTHNDSGGKNRIFAFDSTGKMTGRCDLPSAQAHDWEDMCAFKLHGAPKLLIADCGDNDAEREFISLYLLDEPDPNQQTRASRIQSLRIRYPNGPRNCEAVAVDADRNIIVLVEKSALATAGIYLIPLPHDESSAHNLEITRVGTIPMPMVTAMDIDADSGDIWLCNYFQAFRFPCRQRNESVQQQLSRLPEAHELPRWRQIEALAIDQAHAVWITSEGSPMLLGKLAN
ncbi:MAG: hypothetical protein MI861_10420, partial [Pirellulales bacterium]|nr:hypothetical protein [Pirellulales bacterium]